MHPLPFLAPLAPAVQGGGHLHTEVLPQAGKEVSGSAVVPVANADLLICDDLLR